MKEYDPKEIEKRWQEDWERGGIYYAKNKGDKYYSLIEFPFLSGEGLHVGHLRPYIGMDIVSRKRRMEGYDVLYPIGWDAFGLPAENFAIKTGVKPAITTKKNIADYKKQLKSVGISFDWAREVDTSDPKYYKWTQWIFLKFLEKGLAYKAKMPINWCPKDKIGLANEEVVDGKCERCGTPVETREKEQWMLAITKYADRLYKDLETVDYPERVKAQQRNWIGPSEGALIKFDDIEVFTTRPDTIFGATFIVKAGKEDRFTGEYVTNPATKEKIPVWEAEYVYSDYGTGAIMGVPAHDERDYEFAKKHSLPIKEVVTPFITDVVNPPKKGLEPQERKAVHAIVRNPSTGKIVLLNWKKYPWKTLIIGGIEDEDGDDPVKAAVREVREETGFKNLKYIRTLGGEVRSLFYAHHKDINRLSRSRAVLFDLIDEDRDLVSKEESDKHDWFWGTLDEVHPCAEIGIWKDRISSESHIWSGEGILTNSGEYDGKKTEEAKKQITKSVGGRWITKYKLRDWIFSRQRYWGEPIPVVHCAKCGVVPVPEKELPVELPKVEKYEPTDTGESPLANVPEWVNTKCPKCGGAGKRETDTMPNWAGSSWYFLRYTDPENDGEFASKKALKHWMPVDWYNGDTGHTTLHLLYSRFWYKFLSDLKLVPGNEPFKKRTSHGHILAEGGVKMSKSKGNVISPDNIVQNFGADTLRVYEMFMGPFEQAIAWSDDALVGPRRFLEKVWRIRERISNSQFPISNEFSMHQCIKRVSEDIENLGFNTAISSLMIYVNELEKSEGVSKEEYETLLKLLAPFAPHITEELWRELGNKGSIHQSEWPKYDKSKLVKSEVAMAIQVNGKVRGSLSASSSATKEEVEKLALDNPEIRKWLEGKEVQKVVVVPQRVVNIVVK